MICTVRYGMGRHADGVIVRSWGPSVWGYLAFDTDIFLHSKYLS